MRIQSLLIVLLTSASVIAQENQKCGTNEPSADVLAVAREHQWRRQTSTPEPYLEPREQREALVIPTYFHVVESQEKNGSITTQMLQDQVLMTSPTISTSAGVTHSTAQLSVLTSTFVPHNISFNLLATTFTINDDWAAVVQHRDMSLALRRGDYATLNIYFQTGMSGVRGGITGLCNFPVADPLNDGINGTSYYVFDGCHVNPDTLPGGPGGGFENLDNAGKTATHEVGHWFGLLHTFDGFECGGEGDGVADTPAQSEATQGCPVSPPKDSCPDQPGADPIHNYMDYSSDECKTEFTPGQEDRMYEIYHSLRKGK